MKTKRRRERSDSPAEPTRKRWRPWRPHDSGSDSGSGDTDENDSIHPGKPVPVIVESVTAKADIIPLFDPEADIFAVQWINKIEQLGAIHNWTDNMKSYFMQSRLAGMARIWHSSLPSYELSWQEWKSELLTAFPKNIDFVESLREMLSRRKLASESMTQYFYNKNAMLTKLEILGDKAVACLIDGLPVHMRAPARAGNFRTPSELYAKFLTVMEEVKPKLLPPSRPVFPKADERAETRDSRKLVCFLCQESGHTVRRCPRNNRPPCTHCKKLGHSPERCWFNPSNTTNSTSSALTSAVPRKEAVNLLSEVAKPRETGDINRN
ncbi:uncharacterized protein LOC126380906 isoform X1 [Pectinophora gossypiella]|uniref:uncharacterized protein LOC126380906 isoform X1 n=1 Tax=Pectinophora gossypiella TaxID=13191 RepID=UPI00214EE5E5|nr:uncharacterized protein LOC126380906 isoform X1 [Pectinophora gossypiella]